MQTDAQVLKQLIEVIPEDPQAPPETQPMEDLRLSREIHGAVRVEAGGRHTRLPTLASPCRSHPPFGLQVVQSNRGRLRIPVEVSGDFPLSHGSSPLKVRASKSRNRGLSYLRNALWKIKAPESGPKVPD